MEKKISNLTDERDAVRATINDLLDGREKQREYFMKTREELETEIEEAVSSGSQAHCSRRNRNG